VVTPHNAPRPRRTPPTPVRRADVPSAPAQRRGSAAGAVLGAVLDHGPVARSTVARLTGLSPSAVTGHSARLLARGLLRERPETARPRGLGRPHVPLEIETGTHLVAGVHIAVTNSTVALMDPRGRIVAQDRLPHHRPAPHDVLDGIPARLSALTAAHAGDRGVLALGAATGSWVDPDAGLIVDHPRLGWRDVPVRDLLTAATGLPVHIDSHARALARAEQLLGPVAARDSSVLLFGGAVVDAAFATSGGVHRGPRSGAGSVAHLPLAPGEEAAGVPPEPCTCGTPRCLQSEVSEPSLLRQAAARGVPVADFRALLGLARAGDGTAVALFRRRARLVGRAAALLLDMFDPGALVVVEPGTGWLPECLADLRAEVATRSWVCDDPERAVLPSSFTGSVLAVAGCSVALGALYADPLGSWTALPAVS